MNINVKVLITMRDGLSPIMFKTKLAFLKLYLTRKQSKRRSLGNPDSGITLFLRGLK